MVWFGKNRRRACERHALGKECLLPRKTASFKTVLTIGVIIGIAVIVIAVIAIHLQQKGPSRPPSRHPSKNGREDSWQALIADGEGEHHYIIEKRQGGPDQGAGAWES
jgi:hypothetical protein